MQVMNMKSQMKTSEPKKKGSNLVGKLQQHGEMIAALSSGLLILLGWLLEKTVPEMAVALFLLAYVVGGYVKAKEGILTLVKEKELDVNLLMFLAAIGAASIGYWLEGGMLIFIFSLSGALESYTLAKSERDLSSLMELKPETARIYLPNGEEKMVAVEELEVGNWIIVKPGERIPADGKVKEGISAVNEATITGEPYPIDKEKDSEVFAGTLNGEGSLVIEVTKAGENTLFAKIIQLIGEAKTEVPQSQERIERLEKWYVKVILLATVVLCMAPHFVLGWTWQETLYRAMVFLVVASPCALVASIMPAVLSAISNGARQGVLFKSGVQLEKLSNIRVVTFDKTGTLTEGKPKVTDVRVFGSLSTEQFLQAAASIEMMSEHPLAKAIVNKAKEASLVLQRPSQLRAITGWGVEAELDGQSWRIGKPNMFSNVDDDILQQVEQVKAEGKTVVLAEREGELMGMVALQDTIRPEAIQAIHLLHQYGIQTVMLTGDQKTTALAIAKEAGIDHVYSELLPEDKVNMIKKLSREVGPVAMVGDGVNDAPALATAQVGIAVGGGSDVALETADVVLMKNELTKVPYAIQLGQRMTKIVKQNIIFALSVIVLLMIANFAQVMTLPFGVVGHEGSTILVILNGLRLLR
ncbi:Cd2+/Zn2+-exporting ATPase [Hazenella coriacea]|uniref:Cd2+/Zn2+-exporting ATPase n=2 Tax=Hazenella coriacea TaxID=1179467 RepID=A0A4R3LAY5_9BACL|nr:Cd2+/Zn2+-exporting ATPase [Hazenella coriacea]